MSVTLDRRLLTERFHSEFKAEPQRAFFSPGRINLIGEHIDYLGGTVLPAAIDRGILAFVRKRDDTTIRLRSVEQPSGVDIDLRSLPDQPTLLSAAWAGYPTGMIRLYGGGLSRGFDVLFASNLPVGSGLSSSAALEVLTGFIVKALSEPSAPDASSIEDDHRRAFSQDFPQAFTQAFSMNDEQRIRLALDAQSVENGYIGVQCGIMDQFAVAMGRRHQALHLNTHTLAYRHVPFQSHRHTIMVMNSNRPRKLSESKYNERRAQCDEALSLIRRLRPQYQNLVDAGDDLNLLADDEVLLKRARHAVTENSRVQQAIACLTKDDLGAFGGLLDESHASLRDDYEVSCFELDTLQELSRAHSNCIGSRMTGAGFGGCAIALLDTVDQARILDFADTVGARYHEVTSLSADIFAAQLTDGVHEAAL